MMERIAAATSLCCRRSSTGSSRRAQSSSSTVQRMAAPTSSTPTVHIEYRYTISGFMMKRMGIPRQILGFVRGGLYRAVRCGRRARIAHFGVTGSARTPALFPYRPVQAILVQMF